MCFRIFLALLSSVVFVSCAINRAPSLNMLEKRADYVGTQHTEESLNSADAPRFVPNRTEPKVADIWIHPNELPNGDYFRGGWIRVIISDSHWELDDDGKETK